MKDNIISNEITKSHRKRRLFLKKANDLKLNAGRWYTIFGQIIFPFFLYLIPVNVIVEWVSCHIEPFFKDENLNMKMMFVVWVVLMLAFLTVAIVAPKATTAVEFIIGFVYLFLAFRFYLFKSSLGITLLICMILFLVIKFVFLILDILYQKESERKRRKQIEYLQKKRANRTSRKPYNDYLFESVKKDAETPVSVSDDEIRFAENENTENEHPGLADEQFVIAEKSDEKKDETSSSDNDYILG